MKLYKLNAFSISSTGHLRNQIESGMWELLLFHLDKLQQKYHLVLLVSFQAMPEQDHSEWRVLHLRDP